MSKTQAYKSKLHIAITILVMVFIFVQSALPGDLSGSESNIIVQFISWITGISADSLGLFVRKAAHFTEFMILGMCLVINVRDALARKVVSGSDIGEKVTLGRLWLPAWLIATAYAATDEIHQLFVPERAGAFTDVCIDSSGAAVGAFIMALVVIRKITKDNN